MTAPLSLRKDVRKGVLISIGLLVAIPMLLGVWIIYSQSRARLDFSNPDDLYTLEKNIGLRPISQEVYCSNIGFLDPIIFYKAKVTPDEVRWLERVPRITDAPSFGYAPMWWRFSLWANASTSEVNYYQTESKWPSVFAYSTDDGWLFGSLSYD